MGKQNKTEPKIYKSVIKPIFTGIYLLVYFVFKGLLYLPKLISEKIKSSISFKISVVYFKIMVRVFVTILVVIVIFFIYVNVINDNVFEVTQVLTIVTISYLFGILLTLIIGAAANREVLYPIFDMTQTVKSISANNLNLRINITGSKDELKELAKTFNDMMNRIEEAYNKQQQFVSDASHELRTPIAVIQGYANMLNRWGKNDPQIMQESIDAIANEAENIKDLVEKLLFIARSDKNTLKLQKEEFDLNELLVEVIKETEMIDKKHNFSQAIIGKIIILADKNRVKQTLRIIIDNSIKYTPEQGEISIKSAIENNYAIVSIIDNGIGVSKEDLDNIFNRFYRSDKSRTKVNEGYGLGLYIAKIIVLRHKGKIKVRSKVDQGTEFQVYLPLGRLE